MKKLYGHCFGFALMLIIFLVFAPILFAEQVDTYKKIQEPKPEIGQNKHIFLDSSYENSAVKIGNKRVYWRLFTTQLLYRINGQVPYFEITQHERDRVSDVVLTPGAYLQIKKYAMHIENGFGIDADYIYRYQSTLEIEHQLIKNLFWKAGGRYIHYRDSEVLLAYPGFTYYFGDHYFTANYGFSLTEARSDAHWGTAKLNLVLNRYMTFYSGGAVGQRLFDIYPVDAEKEGGFIVFGGMEFKILDHLKVRAGYSHSQEKPNFIKRSIDGGLSVTF